MTAGHGTNDALALLPGNTLEVPITKDRPHDAKYFRPPADQRHLYTSDVMPVIAYLDKGQLEELNPREREHWRIHHSLHPAGSAASIAANRRAQARKSASWWSRIGEQGGANRRVG